MDAATRDAIARARIAQREPVAPGSLAHLAGPPPEPPARDVTKRTEQRRARKALRLEQDLEAELTGAIRRTTSGVGSRGARSFIDWARSQHRATHPEAAPEDTQRAVEDAAALDPTCEVEWSVALTCATATAADGFDLEAHAKAVAAVVRWARRVR